MGELQGRHPGTPLGGRVTGARGQIDDGSSELERAVDLDPQHLSALKNLAVLSNKARFCHKAVEIWERCVHVARDVETRESIKGRLAKLL